MKNRSYPHLPLSWSLALPARRLPRPILSVMYRLTTGPMMPYITQLAADGVIEGYGNSTFKGDRSITRYEMAQMVAKAMAKQNVGGTDKALIDKLAAEFADELNNLGVRVAQLEKNADKVQWHGMLRYDIRWIRVPRASRSVSSAIR